MLGKDDNDLRRDFEILKEILGERMKAMKAQNEATIAKNETAIERLRTTINEKMEENAESIRATSNANTTKIMIAMGISVAFLSGVIGFLTLFISGNS